MLDVTIKYISVILIALSSISFVSCGNKQSAEEKDAEALMSKIKVLYTDKNYDQAMLMIDSLMKAYPGMIDVQRRAMHIQTMITEKKTLSDSIANEVTYQQNVALADSVKANLKFVKQEDMVEGYYVDKTMPDNGMPSSTQLVARVSKNGDLSVLSSLRGHKCHHNRLNAETDSSSVFTAVVPTSNPRNYKFSDNGQSVELVTFNGNECEEFCTFIASNASLPIIVKFIGNAKSHQISLSKSEKTAFSNVVAYHNALCEIEKATTMRLKFAQKLKLARKQIKQTATNLKGQD